MMSGHILLKNDLRIRSFLNMLSKDYGACFPLFSTLFLFALRKYVHIRCLCTL